MKYVILIPDGAADRPRESLGGKTPLEVAKCPNMDMLCQSGLAGLTQNVPAGMSPGSDVANLSIFGYNPAENYTGRAPLEAANRDIKLKPGEVVFRANTVCLSEDGEMVDFAGGHPSSAETTNLIEYLDSRLNIDGVKLYHGVSYRHLCVVAGLAGNIPETTPPHDITGQNSNNYHPKSDILNRIMQRSEELLKEWEGNKLRLQNGKKPITRLWLWGGGVMPEIATYKELFDISGAIISAVDLLQGIGKLAGLEVIEVPGATGYYDTNYSGKGEYAIKALDNHDLVIIHVEAPDEAGHNGDESEKILAIENIDRKILGPIIEEAKKRGDLRILCLPDHPTPLELKTHSSEPVPYVMWGVGIGDENSAECFSEKAVAGREVIAGYRLLPLLLK